MLDDLYQPGIDASLRDLARNPPPAPTLDTGFSFWRMLGGAARGLAAGGVMDPLSSAAGVGGAFPDMTEAYGGVGNPLMLEGVDPMRIETDRSKKARARVESGESFANPVGEWLRDSTRENLMPDPVTSHAAEQLAYGVTRYGAKAVAYTLLTGPAGGALLTGVDEGMATADELKREGVDRTARTAAGILAGTAAGAGVVMPVAGKTLAGTVGLVAASGPGAFMAQQAATRQILENAGYDELADQYDPFDPVGLAVSTLVPAAFGAFALRGARRGAAKPGDTPPPAAGDPEIVDAARVNLANEALDAARLTPADDFEGAQAHMRAVEDASNQLAAGQRVEVELPDGTNLEPAAQLAQRAASALEAEAPGIREELSGAAARPRDEVGAAGRQPDDRPSTVDPAAAGGAAESPLAAAEARLAEVVARRPDLMVKIDETGTPMRLDEVVERIRAESQANTKDADLIQVAANCFLSSAP